MEGDDLMDITKKMRARISTVADGEAAKSELELTKAVLQTKAGQQTLETYQQIGKVLRDQETPELSSAFTEKLTSELTRELGLQPEPNRHAAPLAQYAELIEVLNLGVATDLHQSAADLLTLLESLSSQLPAEEMVRLAVRARDVLAIAKGKGWLAGVAHLAAMTICARYWKQLHPRIASTRLAGHERAVIDSYKLASKPLPLRVAMENAGTLAWLYEVSALLGEDVTLRLIHNPQQVPGSRYHAGYTGNVLHYLQCGASGNVNQFMRLVLPDLVAPPLVIAGECMGGTSGYGLVRDPRAFMSSQGVPGGVIGQRDPLYPLSRALHMARATMAVPAGRERKLAGKAIEQAGRDGLLIYLVVRGRIDIAQQAVSSDIEVFL
jgi:hypothetical protein